MKDFPCGQIGIELFVEGYRHFVENFAERKFRRKTFMVEFAFNKVADLQATTLLKARSNRSFSKILKKFLSGLFCRWSR